MYYIRGAFEDEEPKESKYKVVTNSKVRTKYAVKKEWKDETGMMLWSKGKKKCSSLRKAAVA